MPGLKAVSFLVPSNLSFVRPAEEASQQSSSLWPRGLKSARDGKK